MQSSDKKILQDYLSVDLVNLILLSGSVIDEDKIATKPAVAVFADGCFWCMEHPFDVLPGIISTISGYTGGHTEKPTYKEVSKGKTGQLKAMQETYDPTKISYEQLLQVFLRNIAPLDDDGLFCDKGEQYKATIFYWDEKKQLVEISKTDVRKKAI